MSKQTISTITDKVVEGMAEWQNRPLDPVYPVVFIDAIYVKIRDGQVANRPIYVALAVTVDGERDILGLWAGDGGEGAKFWLRVLTEIRNRGVGDVCIVVCDGLKGLPKAIENVWPQAVVQTCVVHLMRDTFRYAAPPALGRRSPKRCGRSTPPRPRPPRWSGSRSSPRSGAAGTRRSSKLWDERLGRVRALPQLRRRDPPGDLLDQRDRVGQRPDPPGGQGPRPLPQ